MKSKPNTYLATLQPAFNSGLHPQYQPQLPTLQYRGSQWEKEKKKKDRDENSEISLACHQYKWTGLHGYGKCPPPTLLRFLLSYEYIHIISLWGGRKHYSLPACIVACIAYGDLHNSLDVICPQVTPSTAASRFHTHRDTPLFSFLCLWTDPVRDNCFRNFPEMSIGVHASVPFVFSLYVHIWVSSSSWSREKFGAGAEPETGSNLLQQCLCCICFAATEKGRGRSAWLRELSARTTKHGPRWKTCWRRPSSRWVNTVDEQIRCGCYTWATPAPWGDKQSERSHPNNSTERAVLAPWLLRCQTC